MYKIFIDNTNLSTLKTSRSNVFILGGFIIDKDNELKLISLLEKTKAKYGITNMPIKWNLKDLRRFYDKHDKTEEFKNLLEESNVWREKLFDDSLNLDYKVIISIFGNKNPNHKQIKKSLIEYCFSNILMRTGLELKSKSNKKLVILDWPESSIPKPFNDEYYSAYVKGESCEKVSYWSGPLKKINFNDSLLFASMDYNACLQFADLIIGAFKEYLDSGIKKKETIAKDLISIIKSKFRGYPDEIIQQGIILQNQASSINKKILIALS